MKPNFIWHSIPSQSIVSRQLPHMLFIALATGFAVAATIGCGNSTDGRVSLSGDVTLAGQPLDRGSIEFHPLEPSGVLTGGMVSNGKFDIPAEQGPKPGKYQVRVFASGETLAADPDVPPGPENDTQVSAERVAAKFNVNSELEVEVSSAGNKNLLFEVSGP